jgi:hypothetical protein
MKKYQSFTLRNLLIDLFLATAFVINIPLLILIVRSFGFGEFDKSTWNFIYAHLFPFVIYCLVYFIRRQHSFYFTVLQIIVTYALMYSAGSFLAYLMKESLQPFPVLLFIFFGSLIPLFVVLKHTLDDMLQKWILKKP